MARSGCSALVWLSSLAGLCLLPPLSRADSWSSIRPSQFSFHATTWDSIGARLIAFDGRTVRFLPDGAKLWTEVKPEGTGPPGRQDFAWTSDAPGRRLFVFGGADSNQVFLNDTWVLHIGPEFLWEKVGDSMPMPLPLVSASLVYDSEADRLVLFGGKVNLYGGVVADFAEAWTLSLTASSVWQLVPNTETQPGPRSRHVAVYDPPGRRMLVWGGSGNLASVHGLYSDLWALDLESTPTWVQLFPTGTAPLGRQDASAVFDPARRRVVVFGGRTELGLSSEVLSLALPAVPSWQTPLPNVPGPPTTGRAASLDLRNDRVLLSGGLASPTELSVLALSPSPAWISTGDPFEPPAETRFWGQAVYDSLRDRLTFFSDGWTWEASFATDPPTWSRHPVTGQGPPSSSPRFSSFLIDAVEDRIIAIDYLRNDHVYFLDLETRHWSSLQVAGVPFIPGGAGRIALDPQRRRLLLLGSGGSGSIVVPTELWELPLMTPLAWNRLHDPIFPYLSYFRPSAILHDPFNDRLIRDGLTRREPTQPGHTPSFELTTSSVDLSTLQWTQQATVRPTQPPWGSDYRQGHALCLDPTRGRVLMGYPKELEGVLPTESNFSGWTSALSTALSWTNLPSGGPRVLREADDVDLGLVFDSRRDRLIVVGFGGLWFLSFDPGRAVPQLQCPADREWTPGVVDTLRYSITNPTDVPVTTELRWTSERAWADAPNTFPRVQLQALGPGETREVALAVLTPDSVAAGSNRISMRARWTDQPARESTCSLRLGDAAAVQWSFLEAEVSADGVRLAWQNLGPPVGEVRIERQSSESEWIEVGTATDSGGGRFVFEDHPEGLTGRVFYRLTWTRGDLRLASEAVAVDLPSPSLSLSIRTQVPLPTGRSVRVAYALPGPGAASIDLVSISGRRAGRWRIAAEDPRQGQIDLQAGGTLRPGVYGLRLVHAGAFVTSKVVVVP